MRKFTPIQLSLLIVTLFACNPLCADTQQGISAYNNADYATAYKELNQPADQGDSKAERLLGIMYYLGQGVAKDKLKTVHWIKRAALQNDPVAEEFLGEIYHFGYGVNQSDSEAFVWMQRAADQGDNLAKAYQGDMYLKAIGLSKNSPSPARWLKFSYVPVETEVGYFYLYSDNVTPYLNAIFNWYLNAANHGDSAAQFNLGLMYANGKGVPQNDIQAAYWIQHAALGNNIQAQWLLGDYYKIGRGVPQNYAKAFYWYAKAWLQQIKILK